MIIIILSRILGLNQFIIHIKSGLTWSHASSLLAKIKREMQVLCQNYRPIRKWWSCVKTLLKELNQVFMNRKRFLIVRSWFCVLQLSFCISVNNLPPISQFSLGSLLWGLPCAIWIGGGEGGERKGEFTVQLLPDLIRYT